MYPFSVHPLSVDTHFPSVGRPRLRRRDGLRDGLHPLHRVEVQRSSAPPEFDLTHRACLEVRR